MQTVKFLKPYYVKKDERFVRVVLAFQYFSIEMDDRVYQFIPLDAREIVIDRTNRSIVNLHDLFVFQKGVRYIKLPLQELMKFEAFEDQMQQIIEEFLDEDLAVSKLEAELVCGELELANVHRLIDQALSVGDEKSFIELTGMLQK
ncbi:hypothetical protein CEY16_08580 [Halalkalibacillus sediminis]|uniref:Uncharacterized protein n=1 Tax=Halalkalibacillus sediminis TaxID=2018042 RepID=A0A2I0QUI0_9BACI|nr:IDEAL domain-containing protein [Halalkalibacillus sediminis]PKR77969.1 hypothetical protein CEY16_08580 [Halalkalibacillus sediminis]